MPRNPAPAARLLATTLRPELRPVGAIFGVLVVAMGLRLSMPVLLGVFVDDAISGASLDRLTRVAALYIVAALTAELLQLAVTWSSVKLREDQRRWGSNSSTRHPPGRRRPVAPPMPILAS